MNPEQGRFVPGDCYSPHIIKKRSEYSTQGSKSELEFIEIRNGVLIPISHPESFYVTNVTSTHLVKQ